MPPQTLPPFSGQTLGSPCRPERFANPDKKNIPRGWPQIIASHGMGAALPPPAFVQERHTKSDCVFWTYLETNEFQNYNHKQNVTVVSKKTPQSLVCFPHNSPGANTASTAARRAGGSGSDRRRTMAMAANHPGAQSVCNDAATQGLGGWGAKRGAQVRPICLERLWKGVFVLQNAWHIPTRVHVNTLWPCERLESTAAKYANLRDQLFKELSNTTGQQNNWLSDNYTAFID